VVYEHAALLVNILPLSATSYPQMRLFVSSTFIFISHFLHHIAPLRKVVSIAHGETSVTPETSLVPYISIMARGAFIGSTRKRAPCCYCCAIKDERRKANSRLGHKTKFQRPSCLSLHNTPGYAGLCRISGRSYMYELNVRHTLTSDLHLCRLSANRSGTGSQMRARARSLICSNSKTRVEAVLEHYC
jgi:hypothetical protein